MPAVYCGANNHAVHVQATGTTCNVTVFDINNPMSVALNPTKPCDHSVYNKTCTAFQGALLIDISPALDQSGQLLKQQNPDVQVTSHSDRHSMTGVHMEALMVEQA